MKSCSRILRMWKWWLRGMTFNKLKHSHKCWIFIVLLIPFVALFVVPNTDLRTAGHFQHSKVVSTLDNGDTDMDLDEILIDEKQNVVNNLFDYHQKHDDIKLRESQEKKLYDLNDVKNQEYNSKHLALENPARPLMGIYRKTLSKNQYGADVNPVIEEQNIYDRSSVEGEDDSLEQDGYMSVVTQSKTKASKTKSNKSQGASQNTLDKTKQTGLVYKNVHDQTGDLEGKYKNRDNFKTRTQHVMDTRINSYIDNKNNFKAITKCNEIRLQRLQERCKDLDVDSLDLLSDEDLKEMTNRIITDNKHHVLIQALPKTGTSSWKMVMLNNSGLNIKEPGQRPPGKTINSWELLNSYGLHNLEQYSTEDIKYRLKHYYSIITVRHPFERLESTFREKFRTAHNNSIYFDKVEKRIIAKYRKIDKHSIDLTDKTAKVTFEEFLRYTLESDNNDRHWNTFWEVAHPCVFPYQYIAKTETADEDMDYIAATKLSHGQSRGSFKYNPTQTEADILLQGARVLQYFSDLNPGVQDRLILDTLEKYMNDMQLFGYRIRKHGSHVISDCELYSPEGLCC